MGVGLTSLGHPWTGQRRPHNHYVIGDPADTTPTAHSVGTAGRRAPTTGDRWPPGAATEELLRCSVHRPEATRRITADGVMEALRAAALICKVVFLGAK
jgi:hypothetical protein